MGEEILVTLSILRHLIVQGSRLEHHILFEFKFPSTREGRAVFKADVLHA